MFSNTIKNMLSFNIVIFILKCLNNFMNALIIYLIKILFKNSYLIYNFISFI